MGFAKLDKIILELTEITVESVSELLAKKTKENHWNDYILQSNQVE